MEKEEGKTVLIVEDERPIREVLSVALERRGITVVQAKNGQDGLVEAQAKRPDLILLDLLMPKMDGRAMLKELENDEKTREIPIILLTNLDELDQMADALAKKQITDYIVKSDWHIDDVVKRVEERLEQISN